MEAAAISGDIISYTSLSKVDKEILEAHLDILLKDLKSFDIYARIIRGDYLEVVVPQWEHGLRFALAIKCLVKSSAAQMDRKEDRRKKYFISYGMRIALGIGNLSRFDSDKGLVDGEAIYMSGRKIDEEHTYSKERITIKNTLFFQSKQERLNTIINPLMSLLDFVLYKATPKQCQVIYYRLLQKNEHEISKILNVSQQVVNDQSLRAGWDAVEESVLFFEKEMASLLGNQ
ncbi:MAG: fumarate hydratase [Bacteroidota bacterium]